VLSSLIYWTAPYWSELTASGACCHGCEHQGSAEPCEVKYVARIRGRSNRKRLASGA
jgi:hypothetical protein